MRAPETIGKYEVRQVLGRGAMGVVYLAYDRDLEREVAVKTMSGVIGADDEEGTDRFYREARSAGHLHHPRIVTIYEMGEAEGVPYIAMERLHGRDLASLLRESGTVSPRRALEIIAQVVEGLDYAHGSGVVHRDVKPANVFLDGGGEVTLVDFGIAKLADSNMTRTGTVIGTVHYMAPEQVRASRSLDGRADLWSATVILYELLLGRKPFPGTDLTSVMYRIVDGPPLGAARLSGLLPERLAAILLRGLDKDPARRYSTGADLAAELHRVLREEPHLDERLEGLHERAADWDPDDPAALAEDRDAAGREPRKDSAQDRPRRPSRLLLPAVALLLVIAGIGGAWWLRSASPAAPAAAVFAPGGLALNVSPWAELTRIEDLDSGEVVAVPGGRQATPLRIELPPGGYRLRLESPDSPVPLELTARVEAGRTTALTELSWPDFDLEAAVDRLDRLLPPEKGRSSP